MFLPKLFYYETRGEKKKIASANILYTSENDGK